jgi:hypothetical protein
MSDQVLLSDTTCLGTLAVASKEQSTGMVKMVLLVDDTISVGTKLEK